MARGLLTVDTIDATAFYSYAADGCHVSAVTWITCLSANNDELCARQNGWREKRTACHSSHIVTNRQIGSSEAKWTYAKWYADALDLCLYRLLS